MYRLEFIANVSYCHKCLLSQIIPDAVVHTASACGLPSHYKMMQDRVDSDGGVGVWQLSELSCPIQNGRIQAVRTIVIFDSRL